MIKFINEINKFLKTNSFHNLKNNLKIINSINFNYNNYLKERTGYQKNLLYTNDKYDIYLIIWYPECKTKIHNHARNGCFMKLLSGELKEFIYDNKTLQIKEINNINKGDFTFIDDNIGYHRISNTNQISASIHIYSPPSHQTKYF